MKRELRERFCWIQNEILENPNLSGKDIMVYLALARYADNETQTCYPSYSRLCDVARVSRPTLSKALKNLEDNGVISVVRKDREVNNYCLLHVASKKNELVKTRYQASKKEILGLVKTDNCNYTHINYTHITTEDIKKLEKCIVDNLEKINNPSAYLNSLIKKHGEENVRKLLKFNVDVHDWKSHLKEWSK